MKKLKKIISMILISIMMLSMMPLEGIEVKAAGPYASWEAAADDALEGTDYTVSGNDYTILTAKGFAWFGKASNSDAQNFKDKTVTLLGDIDLLDVGVTGYGDSITEVTNSPLSWPTINFNGTFDGDNHTVSNLYISNSTQQNGMFGIVDLDGIIKNVGLIDSKIVACSTGAYNKAFGSIVGFNWGTVENCYNTGDVISTVTYDIHTGGIAGENIGTIENCYNTGNVEGQKIIGGIAGHNGYDSHGSTADNYCGTIINSYNTGDVKGDTHIGGIVGKNSGPIESCHNEGDVTANSAVGGISGHNTEEGVQQDRYLGSVKNSYNTGNIIGEGSYRDKLGGITGENDGTVENSYNTGDISGKDNIGGVVGKNKGTISTKCYNSGTITGSQGTSYSESNMVGGVAGINDSLAILKESYNLGAVNGQQYVGGVAGTNRGTVEECFNSGDTEGTYHTGGVVGESEYIVKNCYNTASLSVDGGIVGYTSAAVSNCYNIGDITGSYVGNIVCNSGTNLSNCYYASDITSIDKAAADTVDTADVAGMYSRDMVTSAFATTMNDGDSSWAYRPIYKNKIFYPYIAALGEETAPYLQRKFDLTVSLVDGSNNPIVGKDISWKYDGVSQNGTTDTDGKITGSAYEDLLMIEDHEITDVIVDGESISTPIAISDPSGEVVIAMQSVTYTKTGTGDGTFKVNGSILSDGDTVVLLSPVDATLSFEAASLSNIKSIKIDGVENKDNLVSGNYTFSSTTTSHQIEVEFKLNTYDISIDQTGKHTFAKKYDGYTSVTPKTVTISNTEDQGTGALTVALSGSDSTEFTLSKTSIPSIGSNDTDSFTVKPNLGLSEGIYEATVTISGTNITAKSFDVSFTVENIPVTYILENVNAASTPSGVTMGTNISETFSVDASGMFKLPNAITVKMGGSILSSGYTYNKETGAVTVTNVTDALDIIVKASEIKTVSVVEPTTPLDPDDGPVIVATPADIASRFRMVTEPLVEKDEEIAKTKIITPPRAIKAFEDIELQISDDGGLTWRKATAEEIGGGKASVFIPFPKGTKISTHDFKIYHFDEGSVNGRVIPLETTILNNVASARVDVSTFSPFAIVALSDEIETGTGSGTVGEPTEDNDKTIETGITIVTEEESRFEDVDLKDWYYKFIKDVDEKDLMNGINDKTFGPNIGTTRAMMAQVIWNMENNPDGGVDSNYSDITSNRWYSKAIAWTSENGIYKGFKDGTFRPDEEITREQIIVIFHRYAEYKKMNTAYKSATSLASFTDENLIGEYAVPAMRWGVGNELMLGKTKTTLDPKGTVTRAEVAAILSRFTNNHVIK